MPDQNVKLSLLFAKLKYSTENFHNLFQFLGEQSGSSGKDMDFNM